jgi:hypothetical protein
MGQLEFISVKERRCLQSKVKNNATTSGVARMEELIKKSNTIMGKEHRDKEVELFVEMDSAKGALSKALAFKRWKDHVLQYCE